ncbi:MAG: ATP-binding protein [Bacteroidales bacterium]
MNKKKNLSRNPFRFGVVIDDDAFCNRKQEIAFLKNQIRNGYSTWLFSPRRYGKTSLVEKVFRETGSATCIFVDLYNIRSLDDFSRKYSEALAKNLFNWKDDIKKLTGKLAATFKNLSPGVSFDEFGNPSFNLHVNKIEQQADIETILEIPAKTRPQRGKRICIAFDEFQEIKRIDPFLLNWMRSSFQRHQQVSYIFLGSKQSMMEDIFASARSPFYEFAVKMNLSVIGYDELFQFIKEKFNTQGLNIHDETIHSILNISDCQPHYTQFFASMVFDLTEKGHDQQSEEFEELWLSKIIRSQADIFQDIYDQLTNTQRVVLQALANIQDEGIFSEDAREKYRLPVSSTLYEALKALQKKALIQKSDATYNFSNPVMKAWLLRLA